MSGEELSKNTKQQIKADAKIAVQRSILHQALGEDREQQQRILSEMSANSAALRLNRTLLEYAGQSIEPDAAFVADGASTTASWISVSAPSAVVQKLERFGPLTDEDRALLGKLVASERRVPGKMDLIREGDNPSHVHVVTGGFACRYKSLAGGRQQIVAFLVPGDFCDLHASILDTMDHSIATLTPSLVAAVPRTTILDLLDRPQLAKAMLKAALVDGATLREWVTNIGQRGAEERIAHLFCELHARLAAVGAMTDDRFSLPISQTELSCALGLSVVHTNKSLKKLKDRKLVTFAQKEVAIIDLAGLQALCAFTPNYLHLS